jgi:acetyl-CoA acyltransferase
VEPKPSNDHWRNIARLVYNLAVIDMTQAAYLCDAIRTPFGKLGSSLSSVRPDDLAGLVLRGLVARNPTLDPSRIDDVILGCANQSGEDNRNIARMAALLAGLPVTVPGATVNRLCGSGMNAVSIAAQAIADGSADLILAGGVESMSRAPLVLSKAISAFDRRQTLEDTTLGWRFINPRMREVYGVDSMSETAENVATAYNVSREDQDAFALRSQQRTAAAAAAGFHTEEIIEVPIAKGTPVDRDEQPRPESTIEGLARLKPVVKADGTVTAGNASGLNDGAAALMIASEAAVVRHGLTPRARIVMSTLAGVAPRVMGIGPIPAVQKLFSRTGFVMDQMDVFELNEAFAAQTLAVTRTLGLPDDSTIVNPNGGAIALGHPLGASGARLVMTAAHQLRKTGGKYGLCAMCIGVGQGIALMIERV